MKYIAANSGRPFSCPNCGRICSGFGESPSSLISREKSVFSEYPDPHYSWEEKHKCLDCETHYTVINGT